MDSPKAASGAAQHPIKQFFAGLGRTQSAPPDPAGARLPQRVEVGLGRLESVLLARGQASTRLSLVGCLLNAAAIAGVLLWVGAYPLRATGHDLLLPLDAAWRVLSGQVPHNDFYSPLGPVFSYWSALWMKLLGPSGSVVHYSILAHGLVVGPPAWYIGCRRFTALVNWLFFSLVLLLAVAPFPVGWRPEGLDTAMAYNRLAFGIVAVLVVEAALPPREPALRPWLEACLVGLLFGILPLLKLNFGIIGAGAQMLVLLQPRRYVQLSRRALFFALGFAIPVCLFFGILGVSPRSFVADMRMVRTVFSETTGNPLQALRTLAGTLAPAIWVQLRAPALAALLVCAVGFGSVGRRCLGAGRLAAVFVFLLAADLAMGVSNTQLPTLTLLPLTALFAFEAVRCAILHAPEIATGERRWLRTLPVRAAGLACVLFSLVMWTGSGRDHLRGLGEAIAFKRHPQALGNTLIGQGFEHESVPYPPSDSYPRMQRAGYALLKSRLRPGDRVVTLDFSNPFNFTLGLPPARGDALWWHQGKTFTQHTFPAPERVFQEASLVMGARRWASFLMPVYGGFLHEHYLPVGMDGYWVLFRRSADDAQAASLGP
jgi:hypothetical protein